MSIAKKIIELLKESSNRTMKWSDIYNLLQGMGYSKPGISVTKDRLIKKGIITQEVINGEKIIRLVKCPEGEEKKLDLVVRKLETIGVEENKIYDMKEGLKQIFIKYCADGITSPWLELDWEEFGKDCVSYGVPEFLDILMDCPKAALDLMNRAFKDAYRLCYGEQPRGIIVTLKSLPESCKTTIEDIRSKDLGKLVEFEGIVAMASKVYSALVKGVYVCPNCGETITVFIDPLDPPASVEEIPCNLCGKSAKLDEDLSEFIDYQELKLQQPIESMKNPLDPPKYITVIHENAKGIFSGRVKVIGIPTRIKKRGLKGKYEIIVRAINIVPVDHQIRQINLSEEELKTIKKIAKIPNVIEVLSDFLFYKIKGHKEIKKALFLQQVRGIPKDIDSSGVLHILLITDPGIGKSTMLKTVAQIPGNTYAAITTATGVGLTATVEKMRTEVGDETWVVKPGVIPRAHGGTACLDEFARKSIEPYLLECMSMETVTINKASISATLPAATSILGACNPKHGRFNPDLTVWEQIHISEPILDRFDLIFAISDSVDEKYDRNMYRHVSRLYKDYKKRLLENRPVEKVVEVDGEKITITLDLLYKYILYARTFLPDLTEEADEVLEEFYVKLRKDTKDADIGVSVRQLESIIKLAGAVAKAKLKDTIDAEDAKEAIDLVMYCYENIAKDGDTIDFGKVVGPPRSKEGKMYKIYEVICDLCAIKGSAVPKEELVEECKKRGLDISEEELDELLEKMKKRGEIYEPKFEYYMPT